MIFFFYLLNRFFKKLLAKPIFQKTTVLSQTVNVHTSIKAANGQRVKALDVFSHSIKFLKNEALKVICERTGDTFFSVSDIQWVLTVPAIWTPVAKQFMREAAYEVRYLQMGLLYKRIVTLISINTGSSPLTKRS